MGKIENERWEAFSVALASGCSHLEAIERSGFQCGNSSSAYAMANKLMKKPEVQARIDELMKMKHEILQLGVTQDVPIVLAEATLSELRTRDGRMREMEQRYSKINQIEADRAAMYGNKPDIPGGSTGFIIKTIKQAGKMLVESYEVDYALLKEKRELEKAMQIELGQLIERREQILTAQQIMEMPVFNELLELLAKDPLLAEAENKQLSAPDEVIDVEPDIDLPDV